MKTGWVSMPFEEVLQDVSSGNPKTLQSTYLTSGRYAVVNQGKELIAGYVDDSRLLVKGEGPAIIFGDHTRIFKYVAFPFCLGADGVKVLRPRVEADTKYIYHYLQAQNVPEAGYSRHFKFLKRLSIILPPLEEQRRIAAILDHAEALKARRDQTLAKLETLTQSLFIEMFGDAISNTSQHSDLGDCCLRITDGTHQPPKWVAAGLPFLFVSNITRGRISLNTEKFISEETHRELTRNCPIEKGDVLYTTVGSYGNAALVRDDRKFSFQRHIAHIKPKQSIFESEFLSVMLNSEFVRRQADRLARGMAQKTLNLGELRSFRVITPLMDQQRRFVKAAKAFQAAADSMEASVTRIASLNCSLQHRAFGGEL